MKRAIHIMFRISLATAIVALVVTPAFTGSTPKGKPFVAIQGQVYEIEADVSDIQARIDSVLEDVESFEDRVVACETAIVRLRNQNVTLQAQIDSCGTDIESLNEQIALLQAENDDLQALIEANSGDIAAHGARINENEGTIASLQATVANLSSLEDEIHANDLAISQLEDDIALINESLARKQEILEGNCGEGFALREINPDGSIVCEDINTGATGLEVLRVDRYVPVNPYTSISEDVQCPDGYTPTGGGFSKGWMTLFASRPYRAGWQVQARNMENGYVGIVLYVQCIKLTP